MRSSMWVICRSARTTCPSSASFIAGEVLAAVRVECCLRSHRVVAFSTKSPGAACACVHCDSIGCGDGTQNARALVGHLIHFTRAVPANSKCGRSNLLPVSVALFVPEYSPSVLRRRFDYHAEYFPIVCIIGMCAGRRHQERRYLKSGVLH
jgi:hypothetical protein